MRASGCGVVACASVQPGGVVSFPYAWEVSELLSQATLLSARGARGSEAGAGGGWHRDAGLGWRRGGCSQSHAQGCVIACCCIGRVGCRRERYKRSLRLDLKGRSITLTHLKPTHGSDGGQTWHKEIGDNAAGSQGPHSSCHCSRWRVTFHPACSMLQAGALMARQQAGMELINLPLL